MNPRISNYMDIRYIGRAEDGTEQWFVPLTPPDKDGKQLGTICDNRYGLCRIRNLNTLKETKNDV